MFSMFSIVFYSKTVIYCFARHNKFVFRVYANKCQSLKANSTDFLINVIVRN